MQQQVQKGAGKKASSALCGADKAARCAVNTPQLPSSSWLLGSEACSQLLVVQPLGRCKLPEVRLRHAHLRTTQARASGSAMPGGADICNRVGSGRAGCRIYPQVHGGTGELAMDGRAAPGGLNRHASKLKVVGAASATHNAQRRKCS